MSQALRELGLDFMADANFERALGVFSEAVRRTPADHRSRMWAARCYAKMGETERAVSVLQTCSEGLLKRDYLLSAIGACRQALHLAPNEKRIVETLLRIHARAARVLGGRALGPPPLPPESFYEAQVEVDFMTLQGADLSDRAITVLASADTTEHAESESRPPLPLFADLERDAFVELVQLIEYRERSEGEVVCREGEGGDVIFVMVAGKAEVTRMVEGESKTIAFLSGGSIFGEISLLTGAPPSSTVTAVSGCDILEIERKDLNQLSRKFPSVPQVLATFAQQRMARSLMATSPLFAHIPDADRSAILGGFKFKALSAREAVIREGEPVTALVLVLAGELVVQKEDPAGGMVSLSILREGDIAGEIALVKGLRATATVAASRKTAIALLDRQAFNALLEKYPTIREFLDGLSDRRLKQIGEALRPLEILDADELVVD
jgi:CRP-like cAMP-binding protein